MSGQRRPIRVVMSTIAWVFFSVAIIASSPETAFAHAVLVSSSPEQGEHLAASPTEFRLHFSEPVGHVATSLVSREGKPKELEPIVSGAEVTVPSDILGDGVYALNWRVVSEDGHPVAASIVFSVGERDADTPLTSTNVATDFPTATITWAMKLVFYLGCLFGVGGVFFASHVERRAPGNGHLAFLSVGGLSAILSVWLVGVELTASSLTSIFEFDIWLAACDSSLGRCAVVTLVALALAAAAVILPHWGRTLSSASFVLIGPAFALTGHASGAGLKWLSFSAVALHVIAAAFWVGALPRLWHVLRSSGKQSFGALARFSFAIPFSIAALLIAGGYLACLQLGAVNALWETAYGNVLIAKLAFVGVALLLGGWNRALLTKPVLAGDHSAAVSMRRLIIIEIVFIVLALTATALWRFTPPPRSLALQIPVTSSVHIHDAQGMATATFETTADLRFDVEVYLQNAEFDNLDPKEVRLVMAAADGSVSAFQVEVTRVAPGLWRATGVQAPCNCDWDLKIDMLVTDFDLVTLKGRAKLRP